MSECLHSGKRRVEGRGAVSRIFKIIIIKRKSRGKEMGVVNILCFVDTYKGAGEHN